MTAGLREISNEIQSLIDSLAKFLNVEITIYQPDLSVLCSTSNRSHYIVGKRIRGHFVSQVVGLDSVAFNENPGHEIYCRECALWGRCPEKADMNYSINMGNTHLGVIGFTAFNESQKLFLCKRRNELAQLLKNLANMIIARVSQEGLSKTNQLLHLKNETLCQMINEPIIAINSEGKVTTFNPAAENHFGIARQQILGKPLEHFCPDSPLLKTLRNRALSDRNENIQPLRIGGETVGALEVVHRSGSAKLKKTIAIDQTITFDDIIGTSESIIAAKEKALLIARGHSTVLLRGESGTGKDLFAQAIHAASPRKSGPFRAINCAAIPEELLESELFGYEEGAFTGASKKGKPGKFELANGGTLFLDEIGDLPLQLQAKLLRVLETQLIERVGGTEIISVNVRLIAATHRCLEEMVREGRFRQDLFYRINVIPLYLPPLRERADDVLLLARTFLTKYNSLFGKNITGFTKEVSSFLLNYSWPGNVRELQNCIEYAINMEQSSKIQMSSLPETLGEAVDHNASGTVSTLKEMEKNYIQKVLRLYGSNYQGKVRAAEALGINLTTLYRKMKQW